MYLYLALYLAEAEVRGNDTGNKVESTKGADKPACMKPVDRAVVTLDALQRVRFLRNQTAAEECTTLLPESANQVREDQDCGRPTSTSDHH